MPFTPFTPEVEVIVKTLFHSLREKARRRYAAAAATIVEGWRTHGLDREVSSFSGGTAPGAMSGSAAWGCMTIFAAQKGHWPATLGGSKSTVAPQPLQVTWRAVCESFWALALAADWRAVRRSWGARPSAWAAAGAMACSLPQEEQRSLPVVGWKTRSAPHAAQVKRTLVF